MYSEGGGALRGVSRGLRASSRTPPQRQTNTANNETDQNKRIPIADIVFGVYHLADHHNKTGAADAVAGGAVADAATLEGLLYATDMAVMSYCPTKEKLCAAVGIPEADVAIFEPKARAAIGARLLCGGGGMPRGGLLWVHGGRHSHVPLAGPLRHRPLSLPLSLLPLSASPRPGTAGVPPKQATPNRPAYAVCLDRANKTVVWGFRG